MRPVFACAHLPSSASRHVRGSPDYRALIPRHREVLRKPPPHHGLECCSTAPRAIFHRCVRGGVMKRSRPLEERFLEKISPPDENGCTLWIGTISGTGYGVIWVNRRYEGAHRVAWERQNGPISPGLHVDHLCRTPRCVNPDHLEPVAPGENIRRGQTFARRNLAKTHCPYGHPLSGDNLDKNALSRGSRACKECNRRRCREWHHRNRDRQLQKMAIRNKAVRS